MKQTQKEKILSALKSGRKTSMELNKICFRYSARINELRDAGHNIETLQVVRKGKVMAWKEYQLI